MSAYRILYFKFVFPKLIVSVNRKDTESMGFEVKEPRSDAGLISLYVWV